MSQTHRSTVTTLILTLVLGQVGCATGRPCPDCEVSFAACTETHPWHPAEAEASHRECVRATREAGIPLGPLGTVNTYLRNCGPHRDRRYDTPATLDWCRRASDLFKE